MVLTLAAGIVAEDEVEDAGIIGELAKGRGSAVAGKAVWLPGNGGAELGTLDFPDAGEAPHRLSGNLDEIVFAGNGGCEISNGFGVQVVETFDEFTFHDNCIGSETVAARVLRGAALAVGRDRTTGFGAIGAGGGDLFFSCHDGHIMERPGEGCRGFGGKWLRGMSRFL